MKIIVLLLAVSIAFQSNAQQTDSTTTNNAISIEASYISDYAYNATGGISTGSAFLGKMAMGLLVNTESAKLWKGGEFYMLGQALHGTSPSETLLGDFQVASNIDGGEHIYLHEFWYSHTFKNAKITIGLQDLNKECVVSEHASNFVNSSFGIPSVIADNVPVSLFPLTTLGVLVTVPISDKYKVIAAVYDGKPTHYDINPYNTDWKIGKQDGTLSLVEFSSQILENGNYKIGYYHHSGLSEYNADTQIDEQIFDTNYGIYALCDQRIWKHSENDKTISTFAQIVASPKSINNHNIYAGGGIVYSGFAQNNNILGLACNYASFYQGIHTSESVVELTYSANISENIAIQPNVQYIINPSGTEQKLKNAMVGIIRVNIEL